MISLPLCAFQPKIDVIDDNPDHAAGDESEKRKINEKDRYSIYLYSLDDEYLPVDKLCLYALEDEEDQFSIETEELIQYFSITSDYEIHLIDFSKEANKTRTEEVYYLDPARKFVLQKSVSAE